MIPAEHLPHGRKTSTSSMENICGVTSIGVFRSEYISIVIRRSFCRTMSSNFLELGFFLSALHKRLRTLRLNLLQMIRTHV